jgi:hypothetical protein
VNRNHRSAVNTGMAVTTVEFRTESRLTIAGDVSEVWTYVCDVGRWHEWAPTVVACQVRDGAPLQPGARLDQRAKGPFGTTRERSQEVTLVDAPHQVAFAGPLGTSAARWGMDLEPMDGECTDAMMWIEVELKGVMRAIPGNLLKRRIQRVSDQEMVSIKAAVEASIGAGPS